jgi:hypothetical protein
MQEGERENDKTGKRGLSENVRSTEMTRLAQDKLRACPPQRMDEICKKGTGQRLRSLET